MPFKALCGTTVVMQVADLPHQMTRCKDSGADLGPFDLLGLFEGVGLAQAGTIAGNRSAPQHASGSIGRPILDYWAEHEEPWAGAFSPMCWSTRSATILDCPMRTSPGSKQRLNRPGSGAWTSISPLP
jgi:hypothetical protein